MPVYAIIPLNVCAGDVRHISAANVEQTRPDGQKKHDDGGWIRKMAGWMVRLYT